MFTKSLIAIGAALVAIAPANAVTNLINNGSFENGFAGFTRSGSATLANPAVVIGYGNTNSYPTGAYGESIPADNAVSASPDAVGDNAAYFVDDAAVNESISQLTRLAVGNYRIGFSAYLPGNGFANQQDATFTGQIIGVTVANFTVSQGTAQNWVVYSGVAQITQAGRYLTSFNFNSFGNPSKDVVIDRVFAFATTDPADVLIPPTPTEPVPEPATWALLIVGFAMTGFAARRRTRTLAA